jgi:hypothetical protein
MFYKNKTLSSDAMWGDYMSPQQYLRFTSQDYEVDQ